VIDQSSDNVYEALGLLDADQMQLKATIASGIVDILKERRLTEAEASSLLGTSQSELARILRGQFRKISTAKMTGYLNMLESVEK
jgi:predicted XRE-type DNA-binding protein